MNQLALVAFAAMAGTPLSASVSVDGRMMPLGGAPAPIIEDDRVQVPMRAIFESLGAEVQYYPETRQIVANRNRREVTLLLDENFAYIDGDHRLLDYPPRVVDGHVMVPLRFVGESLGARVHWNAQTRTVHIRTDVDAAQEE